MNAVSPRSRIDTPKALFLPVIGPGGGIRFSCFHVPDGSWLYTYTAPVPESERNAPIITRLPWRRVSPHSSRAPATQSPLVAPASLHLRVAPRAPFTSGEKTETPPRPVELPGAPGVHPGAVIRARGAERPGGGGGGG